MLNSVEVINALARFCKVFASAFHRRQWRKPFLQPWEGRSKFLLVKSGLDVSRRKLTWRNVCCGSVTLRRPWYNVTGGSLFRRSRVSPGIFVSDFYVRLGTLPNLRFFYCRFSKIGRCRYWCSSSDKALVLEVLAYFPKSRNKPWLIAEVLVLLHFWFITVDYYGVVVLLDHRAVASRCNLYWNQNSSFGGVAWSCSSISSSSVGASVTYSDSDRRSRCDNFYLPN